MQNRSTKWLIGLMLAGVLSVSSPRAEACVGACVRSCLNRILEAGAGKWAQLRLQSETILWLKTYGLKPSREKRGHVDADSFRRRFAANLHQMAEEGVVSLAEIEALTDDQLLVGRSVQSDGGFVAWIRGGEIKAKKSFLFTPETGFFDGVEQDTWAELGAVRDSPGSKHGSVFQFSNGKIVEFSQENS